MSLHWRSTKRKKFTWRNQTKVQRLMSLLINYMLQSITEICLSELRATKGSLSSIVYICIYYNSVLLHIIHVRCNSVVYICWYLILDPYYLAPVILYNLVTTVSRDRNIYCRSNDISLNGICFSEEAVIILTIFMMFFF